MTTTPAPLGVPGSGKRGVKPRKRVTADLFYCFFALTQCEGLFGTTIPGREMVVYVVVFWLFVIVLCCAGGGAA